MMLGAKQEEGRRTYFIDAINGCPPCQQHASHLHVAMRGSALQGSQATLRMGSWSGCSQVPACHRAVVACPWHCRLLVAP
jgi:hypothetical protein